MTADEARKIAEAARNGTSPDLTQYARIVLDLWKTAIEKAAKAGKRFVKSSDVGRVRTPVPDRAHDQALDQLRHEGYGVEKSATETLVKW